MDKPNTSVADMVNILMTYITKATSTMANDMVAVLLILSKLRSPGEGPPLIMTEKTVVPHWIREFEKHIHSTCRLKVLVLDNPVSLRGLELTLSLY